MTAVSVVLPTYEERDTIVDVIRAVRTQIPYRHRVLVVDDSPTPATADAVRSGFGHTDAVAIIRRADSDGLASAVLTGFEHAIATDDPQVLVCMDADGQHPASAAHQLVEAVRDGADVAVGTRFSDGGGIDADWPVSRRVMSHAAAWATRWCVPTARGLSDPMSGLFAVDAATIDGCLATLEPDGFKILLELLARCPVETVTERGYQFRPRTAGESALDSREIVRFGRHLLRASVPSRSPDQPLATDGGEH